MGRIDQRLCVYGRCLPRPLISGTYRGKIKTDFILLGSKITADGDCSHEIKRCLLLGKKAMTNLDSILKSRAVTLPTKVHLVKAMYSRMDVRVGPERRLNAEELMLLRCGVGEDS